jgi:uncharacterized membrane protein YkvA (DUF1232 family)
MGQNGAYFATLPKKLNMQNTFFQIAKNKAAQLLGKRGRLLLLVLQLADKLRTLNWQTVKKSNLKEKFLVLGRITKAYASGNYRNIPWKPMVFMVAAILYFISPIDLIPDLLPITGLTDDFAVLLWVYNSAQVEIDKFLAWEKSHVVIS